MAKAFKWIGSILAIIMLILLLLCAGFTYATKYRVNPVDIAVSPDGKYELLFQQIGDPEWPFGDTHARLVLKNQSKTIQKYSFDVANDGGIVRPDSWKVVWEGMYVEVIISGEEQEDAHYILYYNVN